MNLKVYISIVSLFFLISCCPNKKEKGASNSTDDKFLMSVSWFQHSGEMNALYYQGFNIARQRLDEAVAVKKHAKPLAVVVDIDETMLDNSPFEVALIHNANFKKGWYDWTAKASAKALPGALEFTKYAESKHVEVFFITNRDDKERIPTLQNLQKVGFAYASDDHLITKSDLSITTGNTSSKEGRRNKVAEDHEIILLIGDNLNDFSNVFEDRKQNGGKEAVEKNQRLFGQKFIILPNPMYGAWEKPLYNYIDTLNSENKTKSLLEKLKGE